MLVLNSALLSLLLPAAVLARPNQHERLHHKRGDFNEIKPTGIHGGPPIIHPTGTAGSSAPFPAGNSTQGGATATGTGTGTGGSGPGSGPVTIQSIISVVPIPMTSGQTAPYSPQSGSPGSPSGAPGGSGGSGSGQECPPATVTVTKANTITVTVQPTGGQASNAPASSSASVPENSSSAPYNAPSTTQTATPVESKPNTEAKAAVKAEIAAKPKAEVKAAAKPAAKPATEEKVAAKPASKPVTEEKVAAKAVAKPVVEQKNTTPQSSSASAGPTSTPSTNSAGAKGILYQDLNLAKSMTSMSWGTNWDSSPMPAVGAAQGNLGYDFVPQLWGPQDVHTHFWQQNSKNATWVMGFNEPNIDIGGGGCGYLDEGTASSEYQSLLKPNQDAGQKVTSPCVSNNANEWLDTFLGKTVPHMKPDAVCFHWYGTELSELIDTIGVYKTMQTNYQIEELWMSEWAFTIDLSSEDASKLMDALKTSGLDRYAYNSLKWTEIGTPNIKAAYTS